MEVVILERILQWHCKIILESMCLLSVIHSCIVSFC